MPRKKGSIGADTANAIYTSGTRLIATHGFEAMSLRQLAADVGIQASSLYNHILNKHALLHGIMLNYMRDLLDKAAAEVPPKGEAAEQLRLFVAFHVRFHMTRNEDLRIINQELRSLEAAQRVEIVAMRDDYEKILEGILRRGVRSRVFRIKDIRVTTFAIIAMLTGIAAWWRPDGRLPVDDLVALHQDLVLRSVGAR
ncbi:TetR family transcriptional regulator [Methylocella silvestris]|uniref:TetR family transcriptional regulator n=1 Tax=Methylocella silvestris TaxID=199596 RepID=A0A2J7TFX4_METSI|nr:TetR family transcriptional regulator [Methylocella silvestris]PNG25681.1 TetR family transcriptional regulator [Methylocella silvestris]